MKILVHKSHPLTFIIMHNKVNYMVNISTGLVNLQRINYPLFQSELEFYYRDITKYELVKHMNIIKKIKERLGELV